MLSLRFNHLLVVLKIYDTGSLSETARQLNLTISAASRSLRKCQEEFGDELFVRNYQGMAPTEKCRAVVPIILRLLPLSENVFRELAEGSVDLALFPTSLGETLPEHFHGLKLFDIHRVCLLRKEHPLATSYAQGKKLTRKAFLKYPKIAVELRQNARGPVFDIDTSSTHDQRKIIEVPHFLGAPYFLEDTNATLVLPHTTAEFFARMLPTLTVIPIPGEKRVYSTRLIWHERNHASSEMQWIRSVFVSTLRKNASEENQTARSEDL